MKTDISDNLSI